MELVSRITLRLSPSHLESELDRTIDCFISPIFHNRAGLFFNLRDSFRRLFEAMSGASVSNRLLRLVSLPIPGRAGFNPILRDNWFDPIGCLSYDISDITPIGDPAEWDRAIRDLLDTASEEQGKPRETSIARLSRLLYYNILSETQVSLLSQAVWKQVDAKTGLPTSTGMFEDFLLYLPEPSGVSIETLLKSHCLSHELEPIGNVVHGFQEQQLVMMLRCSKPLRPSRGSSKQRFLRWKLGEAKAIFSKLAQWWQDEGQKAPLDDKRASLFFGESSLNKRYDNILDVLHVIILPSCKPGAHFTGEVLEFVRKLESRSVLIELLLPLLARLDSVFREECVPRLTRAMSSLDAKRTRLAYRAVYEWVMCVEATEIGLPPNSLLHQLAFTIAARRQPGLASALDCAEALAKGAPDVLDELVVRQICVGLEYLLDETVYINPLDFDGQGLHPSAFPTIRKRCAALVAILRQNPHADAAVMQRWKEAAETDPLPEVRRAIG